MLRDMDGFDATLATELFFSANVDMLCVFEIEGAMRLANPAWRRTTGWSTAELTSRPLLSFIHPADIAEMRAAARAWALNSGAPPHVGRFLNRDGGRRLLEWRAFAPQAAGLIYATVRDVTEDQRSVVHARALEAHTGVGSWEMDLDTQSLFWSPATYAIHEVDPNGFDPQLEDGLSFYPAEVRPVLVQALDRLTRFGEPYDLELPFVTARGRSLWVRGIAAAELRESRVLRAFGTFQDVTEDRARRQHLLRLGAVAERTTNAVIVCDADHRIEWVNPAFERMFGVTRAEAEGETPGALLVAEGLDPTVIRAALDAGSGVVGEARFSGKDGRDYWVHHEIQPVRDEAGTLTGFIAIASDIIARKQAEARMEQAERDARDARDRLTNAIDALPDSFLLFDAEDRLVTCNARFREFYPDSHAEITTGTSFEAILRYGLNRNQYPDAIGQEDAWLAKRLAAHRSPGTVVEQQVADGRWFRAVEKATPDGGRVGLRIDITEIKEEKRRLSNILQGTDAGTWEWNVQTGETIFNERWAEIVGYSLDELQPLGVEFWKRLIHPDDLKIAMARQASHFEGGVAFYEVELRMRHRLGHWIWVLSRGRVATWTADGEPIWMCGTHQDITRGKRVEAELIAARFKAEQATEAKSMFLATMSHEIRTPMNGVLGVATLLDDLVTDPAQKRLIATIRASGEALLSVLNDILDLSKIEAGKLEIEAIPFTPADLAHRVESLHAPRAAEKALEFAVLTSRGADRARLGDPGRILQILHNLVSNAIKFTMSGEVAVTLKCAPEGPLTLDVRDTGIGMSEAQIARVFTAFTQADSSTSREFGGTGLGMSIVRQLVDAMNGRISIDSRPGAGTRVSVTLPLDVAQAEASALRPAPRAPRRGLRVLAADDVSTNRLVLQAMLGKFDAVARIVAGGREAVAASGEAAYDLVLLDISMPEMDGLAALAAIRDLERRNGRAPVPAVAVTANAMKHQIADYLAAGFARHISKPIDLAALGDCLAAVCGEGELA